MKEEVRGWLVLKIGKKNKRKKAVSKNKKQIVISKSHSRQSQGSRTTETQLMIDIRSQGVRYTNDNDRGYT